MIKTIQGMEDYKDWQADKALHDAYNTRCDTFQQLVRKQIDHDDVCRVLTRGMLHKTAFDLGLGSLIIEEK